MTIFDDLDGPPTFEDLARVRRRGLFTVEAETRTVYRSNLRGLETKRNARKTRMTASRAYLDAAWALWCEGHPCTCRLGLDLERGRRGRDNTCPEHVFDREATKMDYWGEGLGSRSLSAGSGRSTGSSRSTRHRAFGAQNNAPAAQQRPGARRGPDGRARGA